MTFSRIAGTGGYLPERVMTNEDMAAVVDTSDEWIMSRTGIKDNVAAGPKSTRPGVGVVRSTIWARWVKARLMASTSDALVTLPAMFINAVSTMNALFTS